jgi:MerR family copper efflux transcriptional regulator
MTTSSGLPLIACSLDGDGQRARRNEWAELLGRATASAQIEAGVRYSFPTSDPLEQQIRELAAAEADCCGFMDFDVARTSRAIHLTVTAAPDGQDALRFIFPL